MAFTLWLMPCLEYPLSPFPNSPQFNIFSLNPPLPPPSSQFHLLLDLSHFFTSIPPQFYLLVEGHLMAERRTEATTLAPPLSGGGGGAAPPLLQDSAVIAPGSIISAAAFLSRCVCVERMGGWEGGEAITTSAGSGFA